MNPPTIDTYYRIGKRVVNTFGNYDPQYPWDKELVKDRSGWCWPKYKYPKRIFKEEEVAAMEEHIRYEEFNDFVILAEKIIGYGECIPIKRKDGKRYIDWQKEFVTFPDYTPSKRLNEILRIKLIDLADKIVHFGERWQWYDKEKAVLRTVINELAIIKWLVIGYPDVQQSYIDSGIWNIPQKIPNVTCEIDREFMDQKEDEKEEQDEEILNIKE